MSCKKTAPFVFIFQRGCLRATSEICFAMKCLILLFHKHYTLATILFLPACQLLQAIWLVAVVPRLKGKHLAFNSTDRVVARLGE